MKKLIIANWKMNPNSLREAKRLFASLQRGLKKAKKAEVVICPPFVYLPSASTFNVHRSAFKLGSQNCFWEEKGAFTGEVSALMLKDFVVKYVILGHSERRKFFQETDETINRKLKQVIKMGLKAVLCVGETKQEKEKEETFKVLEREIKEGLKEVAKKQIKKVIVAYEPIWAIGTGNSCDVREAETCILFIRKIIAGLFSKKTAAGLTVLYGGSVNSANADGYLQSPQINGLLVGGASLDAEEFSKIVNFEL